MISAAMVISTMVPGLQPAVFAEETVSPEIVLQTADRSFLTTIKNETGLDIAAPAQDGWLKEKTASVSGEDTADILLVCKGAGEEEEREILFESVALKTWKNLSLREQLGFFYLNYTDASGEKKELAEKNDGGELGEAQPLYTTKKVNLRETPDPGAEVLSVVPARTEVSADEVLPGWIRVDYNGTQGYIAHQFLVSDLSDIPQENAIASVAAAAPSVQVAEPSVQTAEPSAVYEASEAYDDYYDYTYEDAYTDPYAYTGGGAYETPGYSYDASSEGRYETGRVQYDNCDGSGTGYYEITYSDGSVEFEEY